MGWPQFLAWAATQGFKNIKLLRQAYNSFKKFPGKDVVLKTAKNLYDDVIKKTSTKDLADKVRQKIKPIIPKQFNKFEPKIVKPKQLDKNFIRISKDQIDDIERSIANKPKLKIEKSKQIIEGMKPKAPKVVNIGDRIIKQMQKEGKTVKFDDLLRIYGKKPPHLKADGGRIDKALPKRSRDI